MCSCPRLLTSSFGSLNMHARAGMPVDLYVGGIEHAVLHLLYARFLCHVARDLGIVHATEPFHSLLTQGMVHGETHRSSSTGAFLKPDQVEVAADGSSVEIATGRPTAVSWEKMSKVGRRVRRPFCWTRCSCEHVRCVSIAGRSSANATACAALPTTSSPNTTASCPLTSSPSSVSM